MAEVDRDVVTDIAPKCEVDGESGVFDTHTRARAFEPQPHDAEFRPARRHARKLEAYDHAMIREHGQIGAPAQAPHQEAGIKVGTFDPVAGVGHAPLAKRVYHGAETFAGRREPILVAGSIGTRPPLNDTAVLELAQPRD